MITVDTRGVDKYTPLIPAITAICLAEPGSEMQIIMENQEAFDDLKTFLSEHDIGFREIYDQEYMTIQFTTKKWK